MIDAFLTGRMDKREEVEYAAQEAREACERTHGTLPAEPAEGLVRVRIAVLMTPDGPWNTISVRKEIEHDTLLAMLGSPNCDTRLVFVTADLPLPEAPDEVVGVVEKGKP